MGKRVFEVSRDEGCQRNLLSVPSLAPFNLLAFVHSVIKPPGKPALGLLFQFSGPR